MYTFRNQFQIHLACPDRIENHPIVLPAQLTPLLTMNVHEDDFRNDEDNDEDDDHVIYRRRNVWLSDWLLSAPSKPIILLQLATCRTSSRRAWTRDRCICPAAHDCPGHSLDDSCWQQVPVDYSSTGRQEEHLPKMMTGCPNAFAWT